MAYRNRVSPTGSIEAIPLRGAWMGNRGILHEGTDVVRNHRSRLWIICTLRHKDWRAPQWQPGHYTVLFFHDEAVALAAGHRPCALCRRPDYLAFQEAARPADVAVRKAAELDAVLHDERLIAGTSTRRLHDHPWAAVPEGAFALIDDAPALVLPDRLVPWSSAGYGFARPRPSAGTARLLTPPTTVRALASGYRPQVDPAALEPIRL